MIANANANPPSAPDLELAESPVRTRPRLRLTGRVKLAFAALAVLIGLVIVVGSLVTGGNASRRAAESKYLAIKPGMNRTEVRGLVQKLGVVMYTGIGPVELMHIDDARYLIAIFYMPDPKDPSPTIYPNGVPHDNWIVKEKVFLELGRTGSVDQWLTGLRLRNQRSFDRFRMP